MDKFIGVYTEDLRESLKKRDLVNTILRTSATIEQFLFEKITIEGGINPELVKSSLGNLLRWVKGLYLIVDALGEDTLKNFDEFNRLRNFFVHNGFDILNEQEVRKRSIEIIEKTLESLDKVYYRDEEVARENYQEHYRQNIEKFRKFILGERKEE